MLFWLNGMFKVGPESASSHPGKISFRRPPDQSSLLSTDYGEFYRPCLLSKRGPIDCHRRQSASRSSSRALFSEE